jgi:hypothetical protein
MPHPLGPSSFECVARVHGPPYSGGQPLAKIMIDGPNIAVVNLPAIGNVHGLLQ